MRTCLLALPVTLSSVDADILVFCPSMYVYDTIQIGLILHPYILNIKCKIFGGNADASWGGRLVPQLFLYLFLLQTSRWGMTYPGTHGHHVTSVTSPVIAITIFGQPGDVTASDN